MNDMIMVRLKSASGDFNVTISRKRSHLGDYLSIMAMEWDTERDTLANTQRGDIALGFIEFDQATRDALISLLAGEQFVTPAEPAREYDLFTGKYDGRLIEPAYMQDAPPITEDDPITDDDFDFGYAPPVTEDDVIRHQVLSADTLGFERGYEAAVNDYRNGLWVDEYRREERPA